MPRGEVSGVFIANLVNNKSLKLLRSHAHVCRIREFVLFYPGFVSGLGSCRMSHAAVIAVCTAWVLTVSCESHETLYHIMPPTKKSHPLKSKLDGPVAAEIPQNFLQKSPYVSLSFPSYQDFPAQNLILFFPYVLSTVLSQIVVLQVEV